MVYHTENQKDSKQNEKRQSISANTKITGLLELSDKDFEAAFKTCFSEWLQTPESSEKKKKIENTKKKVSTATKKIRRYKAEPSSYFRTEKYNNQ